MHRIPAEFANPELERNLQNAASALRTEMDKLIPRERQGAVFHEGQQVELNGAKFVVRKIIKRGLVLHGVPDGKKGNEGRDGT